VQQHHTARATWRAALWLTIGFYVGFFIATMRARTSMDTGIVDVHAREILDSRGNPQSKLKSLWVTDDYRAAVPSGAPPASTGRGLRDGDQHRYLGKEKCRMRSATSAENRRRPAKAGCTDQRRINDTMIGRMAPSKAKSARTPYLRFLWPVPRRRQYDEDASIVTWAEWAPAFCLSP
jgi:hypothetical protein